MDEEDTAWLAIINKTRVKQGLSAVSVDTLELLMDRLEKESYFQVGVFYTIKMFFNDYVILSLPKVYLDGSYNN